MTGTHEAEDDALEERPEDHDTVDKQSELGSHLRDREDMMSQSLDGDEDGLNRQT